MNYELYNIAGLICNPLIINIFDGIADQARNNEHLN